MKAISYDRFGPIDVLHPAERPEPALARGDVLVAVEAASLNVIDARARSGSMGPLVNKRFPKTPGADLTGRIIAIGSGVTGFKVGDTVFGAVSPFTGGALAERVAVPAKQIALRPAGLSAPDAAALPIAGLAALQALRDLGKVAKGQRVLIHGASGGVGHFAVQIAKSLGAHVTAVVGTSGLAAIAGFGADVMIDYRRQPQPDYGAPFDVIINASGRIPYTSARALLTPKGRLIEPSPTIPLFIGASLANLFRSRKHLPLATMPRTADLEWLAGMVMAGSLKPLIAQTYTLDEAKAGFAALEGGGTAGKIVVTI